MLVYWLIFAVFAVGAISFASNVSKLGVLPISGAAAAVANRRSVGLIFAGGALLALIGLRYKVGGDWANYLFLFRTIAPLGLFEALSDLRQEPGYIFLNWLAARVGGGMAFVNFVSAIPFTHGLMRLCRQQPNPWLALLVATPFLIIVVAMGYTSRHPQWAA